MFCFVWNIVLLRNARIQLLSEIIEIIVMIGIIVMIVMIRGD